MKILKPTLTFTPGVLPIAKQGLPYSQQIDVMGSVDGNEQVSVIGTLPEGFTLVKQSNTSLLLSSPLVPIDANEPENNPFIVYFGDDNGFGSIQY